MRSYNGFVMTLDGFLTFLTLIIAAYAIIPTVARLRLRLHILWPLAISIVGFSLVIYFEFFSLLALPCPKALGSSCGFLRITNDSPINSGQAAFIVVIIWLGFAWIAFSRRKLSAHSLPTLSRLASELAYEDRYAELTKIMEPHVQLLDRAATRKLKWPALRDRLMELNPANLPTNKLLEQIERGDPNFSDRSIWYRAAALIASRVAMFIPNGRRAEEAANEIFRVLLETPELTHFIGMSRPYFGVQLLSCSVHGVHDFCDDYMRVLIANSRSVLYKEIKQNQNISSTSGYWFPEHNCLLHFFFNDARTAERLGVWKPLGEFAISALRPDTNAEYVPFLNGPSDSFKEEEWSDKTFVAIRFFDLMVTAAEYQGIQWHMWLYYFPFFLDGLLRLYDASGENIDPDKEWPTRAAYLIYELFSALTGWIEAIQNLPKHSPHVKPDNDNLTHENGNIPKSAILALASCLESVLTADSVSERVKESIHDMVMRTLRRVSQGAVGGRHRAILIKAIIRGGTELHTPATGYGDALKRLWRKTDHVVRADIRGYETRLLQAYL